MDYCRKCFNGEAPYTTGSLRYLCCHCAAAYVAQLEDNVARQSREIAELKQQTAHLIGALKDQWVLLQRARGLDDGFGGAPMAPNTPDTDGEKE